MGVKDETSIIMLASSIHTKMSLIVVSQNKYNVVKQFSQEFTNELTTTFELGLPHPWTLDIWFYSVEGYNDSLIKQRNNTEHFKDVSGPIRGKLIYEDLSNKFMFLSTITNLYQNLLPASFDLYTKLDIAARNMTYFKYLEGNEWHQIAKLRSKDPFKSQMPQVASTSTP
jgi:hypothetical protein